LALPNLTKTLHPGWLIRNAVQAPTPAITIIFKSSFDGGIVPGLTKLSDPTNLPDLGKSS